MKLEVSISGFSQANIKISGTNVNFSVAAGMTGWLPGDPPWYGDDPWDHISIVYMRLWFSEVSDEQYWEPGEVFFSEGHGVRLSTTHFTNGSKQIHLDVIFLLERDADPDDFEYVPMSTTVDVEIYNRALLLATQEKWAGSWVQDLTAPPGVIAASCMPKAQTGLQSMNHIIEPGDPQTRRQSSLVAPFNTNTVFYTVTHGTGPATNEPYGIRSSYSDTMPWQNIPGYTSVSDMCLTGRGEVPKYNLVVLICCTGVANGAWNSTASAFGITYNPPSGNSPDRCCMAYTAPVGTSAPNDTNLPTWIEKFLQYLSQGYTVRSAEERVYRTPTQEDPNGDNIKIYSNTGSVIRPIFAGDQNTKLKGAYLSEDKTAPCFIITS